ncbi:MAG TPA: tRNA (adenosine(37)-N6)-dimethylallyltransferase MiaA [Candidatus Paceibacterota bacterium]
MRKVLVIVGSTASGKSALGVRLAKKFKGEIISADSRQVYKGLDIGTGKITKKEMRGIPHYLLNVTNPKKQFSVSEFLEKANEALAMIYHSNHLPIITGGTGFYIDALAGKISLPEVPLNKELRKKLLKLSTEKLFQILKKKDSRRARTIDKHNKVRLIRALEIVEALGRVPIVNSGQHRVLARKFEYIGLKPKDLDRRIYGRLLSRLSGIIQEAKKLIKLKKLSYKRMEELGLEYRYVAMYLQEKLSKKEMVEKLYIAIRHYAKRQMTWFKRNKSIKWFTLSVVEGFEPSKYSEIEKYVRGKIFI